MKLVSRLIRSVFLVASFALPFGAIAQGQILNLGNRPIEESSAAGLSAEEIDSLALRGGDVNVSIELFDEPTAVTFAKNRGRGEGLANAEAKIQLAKIQQVQRRVLAALNHPSIGANVHFQTQRVFNGFGVRVNAKSLAAIAALPEVKAVHVLVPHVTGNAVSVPFISTVAAWTSPSALHGEGIRIGVIDTGIDYIHRNFGGSGLASDYSRNNKTLINDGLFPTAKVVGGYDFVGDAYTGNNTPVPDPDPMDCFGHGSHVAGTVAGYGVTAAGDTYTGPLDATTASTQLKIGPGVAPKASLYALRVFGCSGFTLVTTQAIEWATDPNGDGDFSDHLDVINMSLGSDFGSTFDEAAIASDNATNVGVIVVAAAGNAGDVHYITGAPGSSGRAISVAASTSGSGFFGIQINSPASIAGLKVAGLAQFGPPLPVTPLTGLVVQALDAADAAGPSTTDGCTAISNAALVSGNIALIDRGTCNFSAKVKNAQLAGARGVIIANNVTGLPGTMTGTDATITIPSVLIMLTDANAIKAQLASGVVASLASGYNAPNLLNQDQGVAFSSRGGRRGDNMLKPDIAAPGVGIRSTAFGTGTESTTSSGTSMATPHIAGVMALLKQLHPTWSVEELKALVMNTATQDLFQLGNHGGPRYGLGKIGAGRVDVSNASTNDVVAMNADDGGLVSVSFGAVEVLGTKTLTKTIKVVNKGSTGRSFAVSLANITTVPGVDYSLPDGNSIFVGAGQTSTLQIQLTANASLMKHVREATMAASQGNTGAQNPRYYLSEATGYVVLTPASGTMLRVPVYSALRPASAMTTAQSSVAIASTPGSLSLNLTGTDVNTGSAFPTDTKSVVTAFELATTSVDGPNTALGNSADLKAIGITTDFKARAGDVANTMVFFGIVAQGNWTTTTDNEFDVYIDTNQDGIDDYVLYTTTTVTGTAPNTTKTDVPISSVIKINSNGTFTPVPNSSRFINGFSANLDTAPYNTNVLVLPLRAGDLGLTATSSTKFTYHVKSFSFDTAGAVDSTPVMTYDLAKPGLDFSGGVTGVPLYFDLNGVSVPVQYNLADYKAAGSKGVLLLHHFNIDGTRDQVLFVNPPVANAGANQTVECQGGTTAVQLDGSASIDPDDTTLTYQWREGAAALGTGAKPTVVLTLGAHTITLRVTDPSGGYSEANVTVTIVDTKKPVMSCPANISVQTDHGQPTAVVTFSVTANDGCAGGVPVVSNPPSGYAFPIGTTTVTSTATDPSGNVAICSFTVTVSDKESPTISGLAVDKTSIWSPDHKMIPVVVSYGASDNSGSVSAHLTVSSDEPIDGLGDGDMAPDWQILDDHNVLLRAERSGMRNGRTYTITVVATDPSGNVSTSAVTVKVPKHQN